ncbi:MAG: ribonuclease D [Acidobacteria bacterium]|nr:ribonuclease D [Acidobacteriota bacterium]MBV9476530.1 ribonuclease D [Acidobacteriota bacterium]
MKWIDRQDALDAALARVGAQSEIAVDTEADSLHSYFDKVCLVQISLPDEDLIVDPLAGINLSKFGEVLANPAVTKIFHGGDYDLRIMNRDFNFTVRNLVDTSVCAQLLGYEGIGLAALLDRHFGLKLNKTHQRADWSMRPLPPDMLEYASTDTHYLAALAAKLREELVALGRWEWALEEFARLENVRYKESEDDGESWRKVKNIGALDRRSLAIVRDLYRWRDALARKADRPPFKVLGNDALVELARVKPPSLRELAAVKGLPRYHVDRYGRELVNLIRRAMEIPEAELPEKNEPKPWIRDKALEGRIERLKRVRDKFAKELKIDGSVLAPRHILAAVATTGSLDAPAMREWQKKLLGDAFLDALKPEAKLF